MRIPDAESMRAFGERLAACLRDKDVLLLSGPMGAGKSELARGIARGLGYSGPIPSPTFTLLNQYEGGRLNLYHFDWYRIDSPVELYEAGLHEVIGASGVTAIEWHEKAPALVPERALEIVILPLNDGARDVTLLSRGGFHALSEDL